MYGSAPIMPTMWSLRSMTDSSSVGAGRSGLILPSANRRFRYCLSCSEWMTASLKCRSSSREISSTISTIQARLRSPPAVPAEPTSSGMRFCRAPSRANLMSRFTAARENEHSPVPRLAGPLSVGPHRRR